MQNIRQQWLNALGKPSWAFSPEAPVLLNRYEEAEFTAEVYRQSVGGGKSQRVLIAFPRHAAHPCPAVAVPFYMAEHMLGYDPGSGTVFPRYQKAPMMLHLLRRGYAVASADAYHLSYYESDREPMDFTRWQEAADLLREDHPHWTGMGKLVFDTQRMIDLLSSDPRVDAARLGIAGFSLGGKMAFYTGCLDDRIRAILAVDFGFGWHQTNWRDDWYWGKKLDAWIAAGMDHVQLLQSAAPKPLCILGGAFDTEESGEMLMKTPGYAPGDGRLKYLRYGTEHLPTPEALYTGYDFLDQWLK